MIIRLDSGCAGLYLMDVPKKIAENIYDYLDGFYSWRDGAKFLRLSNAKEIVMDAEYEDALIEYKKAENLKKNKKGHGVQDFLNWLNEYPLKTSTQKAIITFEPGDKNKDARLFDPNIIEVFF